jgi:four helix bundle protein
MRDYKKLEVWKKSHQLTLITYKKVLPLFPTHEAYGLASQMKRACYSIPMNIVEGSGRRTEKDFTSFLDIALGSAHEYEYCCLLAYDLDYLNETLYNQVNTKANEIKAMLIGLIKSIRTTPSL